MTVVPFSPRAARPKAGFGTPATVAAVTGSLDSPSGQVGTFTGSFRLERFVSQSGKLAAAGVFTGVLTDADGSRIGMGSRRQTAAVEVQASGTGLVVRLGPLDVNLLGLVVAVYETSIQFHDAAHQRAAQQTLRLLDSPRSRR